MDAVFLNHYIIRHVGSMALGLVQYGHLVHTFGPDWNISDGLPFRFGTTFMVARRFILVYFGTTCLHKLDQRNLFHLLNPFLKRVTINGLFCESLPVHCQLVLPFIWWQRCVFLIWLSSGTNNKTTSWFKIPVLEATNMPGNCPWCDANRCWIAV